MKLCYDRQVKRYGQVCPLARALDIIGERWSLLVVRELTLGPRRYSDLRDGLPGVPTNLLVTRLNDLQAAGVITKRTLPPPTAVTVYELTEAGQALRPAVSALRAWGARYGSAPAETDVVRPAWALLSAASRPTTLSDGRVCELRVGPEFFHLGAVEGRLTVQGGPAPAPDAVVALPIDALLALLTGHTSVAAAYRQATVTGDTADARRALASVHSALPRDAALPTRS